MKNQALFSSKDKSKKLKCCLLQFLFGTLRVKTICALSLFTLKLINIILKQATKFLGETMHLLDDHISSF